MLTAAPLCTLVAYFLKKVCEGPGEPLQAGKQADRLGIIF